MKTHCKNCGLKYEPEPGFYYGGMYASYGLSVGVAFFIFLLLDFIGLQTLYSVTAACLGIVFLIPVFFRMGRLLWLNLFVRYRNPG